MRHNDDAFATMLLMSQINPSREELVLPLSSQEWHELKARVGKSDLISMGALLRADMSELMMQLGCTEAEAYRLCVLLGRTLPLSISMEQMSLNAIELVTYDEREYPDRLRDTLGMKAPPMLYIAGRPELMRQSAIAILGALNAKGDAAQRVRRLAREATEAGYVIVTDGQNGLGHIALDEAIACGGRAILVLGGAMAETLRGKPDIAALVSERRMLLVSQFHPDAPHTPSHAQLISKCLYALSEAAFVFACDEEKGSTWAGAVEALRSKWCPFVYALDTDLYSGNRPLIARGAERVPNLDQIPFSQLSANWASAQAEQTCLFDWNDPRRG